MELRKFNDAFSQKIASIKIAYGIYNVEFIKMPTAERDS